MGAIRVILGGIAGGILGWCAAWLLLYFGIGAPEHLASWMAVVFSLHGAIVSKFGWKYWMFLGIEVD